MKSGSRITMGSSLWSDGSSDVADKQASDPKLSVVDFSRFAP